MMRCLACVALLGMLLACGKYGPPVRALPEDPAAATANGTGTPNGGAPGSTTAPAAGTPATEPDLGGPPLPDGSVPPGEEPDIGLGEPLLEGEGPVGIDPGQGTLPEESEP